MHWGFCQHFSDPEQELTTSCLIEDPSATMKIPKRTHYYSQTKGWSWVLETNQVLVLELNMLLNPYFNLQENLSLTLWGAHKLSNSLLAHSSMLFFTCFLLISLCQWLACSLLARRTQVLGGFYNSPVRSIHIFSFDILNLQCDLQPFLSLVGLWDCRP